MKIFLTGASGQVGYELHRRLSVFGEIVAPSRQQLNLSDISAVQSFLEDLKPDLIVNAAAWTAVDAAETQRDEAFQLNAELPRCLAEYAQKNDIWLIHYSSDYVYPGDGEQTWQEDSCTGPLSVYGASKLAGDNAVESSGAKHLIFRTSWVYSARGQNFMKTMLRLGREREYLSIVSDQIGAPTPAHLIADITAIAVYRGRSNPIDSGVYHLAPRGQTSWYRFAMEIFAQAQCKGIELSVSAERVTETLTSEYKTAALRPLNSRLQLEKLETALGIIMPEWSSQLSLVLGEYLGGSQKEYRNGA